MVKSAANEPSRGALEKDARRWWTRLDEANPNKTRRQRLHVTCNHEAALVLAQST